MTESEPGSVADFLSNSSPRWDAGEALHVANEAARAFQSKCPKCGAAPGVWCEPYGTMHYERWGYGSL